MWQGLSGGQQTTLDQAASPRTLRPVQGLIVSSARVRVVLLTTSPGTALRTAWNGDVQDRHPRACALVDKYGSVHDGGRRWQRHVRISR
jgi:hypothetical protein